MDTHIQGPVIASDNYGAVISQRLFPVTFNDRPSESVKLCKIDATEQNPVLVEMQVFVTEVFNAGTSNVLVIGNAATEDEFFAAADIDETTVGNSSTKKFLLTSGTEIRRKYTPTGTAPTTGKAYVVIRIAGTGKGQEITY